MSEKQIRNIIRESVREILSEGVETKNMKLAKHYLYNNKGFDEERAMKCIGQIKTDIPNSRMAKCKFMLAMVRMFCNGELSDAETIMKVNKSLKYAASDAHVNEYDNDLNGMSASQFIEKFSGSAQVDLENDRNELSQQQYNSQASQYEIIRINSFDEASEYSNYVSWCVTHYPEMYASYTANGINLFYFCLRNGWRNEVQEPGEGCPLDSYGLSMIAVSVTPDGSCNTVTCRWNHENGGNDNIMTTKQLSEVIGYNFYDVFKPLTQEEIEIARKRVLDEIEGELEIYCDENNKQTFESDPYYGDEIEQDVYSYYSEEHGAYVLIDEFNNLLIDMTFDEVETRYADSFKVENGHKSNVVLLENDEYGGVKGRLISEEWFDGLRNSLREGYVLVMKNKKFNLINRNGEYLLNEWLGAIGTVYPDNKGNFIIDTLDNFYSTKTQSYIFDRSIETAFNAREIGTFLKFKGDEYYQLYKIPEFKLKAPWKIRGLLGYDGSFKYIVVLTDGSTYKLDSFGNLCDDNGNTVKQNPIFIKPESNESLIRNIIRKKLNEVRYIDSRYEKYNGKVNKNHWTDSYNQEPIKDNDTIRVYHGCTLQTACDIAINGTSGKTYHPRQYSYESGMNPLGIFVTTDFETAKKFGVSNQGMAIIEFTARASDLESPVWNGQDSYFGQGSMPMPFNNKEERNAQKERYRQNALNTKDETYFDYKKLKDNTISKDYIRKSDKPEVAVNIFDNPEHQALFMGDLNPNQIKRIWVNLPGEDGYVKSTTSYIPMSKRDFLKKFGDKKWQDGYDYKGQPVYMSMKNHKLFKPNEDCKTFDDLVDRLYRQDRKFYKSREQIVKNLKDMGMLSKTPERYATDTISSVLWPKQIIQLYGKDYFEDNFDRLGQV